MKSESIARLLPEIVYRTYELDTPLAALLQVMEDLQDPIERTLNELDATFNAYRAPDAFVGMLARWVDLQRYLTFPTGPGSAPGLPTLPSGHGYLRELVASAADLARVCYRRHEVELGTCCSNLYGHFRLSCPVADAAHGQSDGLLATQGFSSTDCRGWASCEATLGSARPECSSMDGPLGRV